jgi:hypothetical protein
MLRSPTDHKGSACAVTGRTPGEAMETAEGKIESFVIRMWLEAGFAAAAQPHWRGHITHVPDGRQRHFEDLDDMKAFIQSFLQAASPPRDEV